MHHQNKFLISLRQILIFILCFTLVHNQAWAGEKVEVVIAPPPNAPWVKSAPTAKAPTPSPVQNKTSAAPVTHSATPPQVVASALPADRYAADRANGLDANFTKSKEQLPVCQNSVTKLLGNSCNKDGNTTLQANMSVIQRSMAITEQSKQSMTELTEQMQMQAEGGAAAVGKAQEECNASMWDCKTTCGNLGAIAKREFDICLQDGNAACKSQYSADQQTLETCSRTIAAECKKELVTYTSVAESTPTKCGAAQAIFVGALATTFVVLFKLIKNADRSKGDIRAKSVANVVTTTRTTTTTDNNTTLISDRDGSNPGIPTTSSNSGSNLGDGASARSATTSTASTQAAQKLQNSKSGLSFGGYDPSQEYKTNSASGSGIANSASSLKAVNTNKEISSANSNSGLSESDGGGSGSVSAVALSSTNRELAAYMPGGEQSEAIKKYEEARSQIRLPHGHSNFEAIHNAFSRVDKK